MRIGWKRFWQFHGAALAAVLFFAAYGRLVVWLFPEQDFYHCFVHDALRLYCPFCGFTRASQALLHLRVAEAFRLNAAVTVALAVYAAVDLRAFVLLCRGKEEGLIPRFLLPGSMVWFGAYTVLLNGLLLFGVDVVGDQLAHWQNFEEWRAAVATVLLAGCVALFLFVMHRLYHRHRSRLWMPVFTLALSGAALCLVLYL